jgi:subtilisin family serine protease
LHPLAKSVYLPANLLTEKRKGKRMALKWTRARTRAAGLLVFSCLCAGPVRSEVRREGKLARSSPLATDGRSVFAVAENGRSVLVGSGSSEWSVIADRPTAGRIRGLAFGRGFLFLSDEQGVVYRLKRGAQAADPIAKGPPLVRPADLAFAGDLLVADVGASAVFRIDARSGTPERFVTGLPAGPLHLAAERDTVVISSPQAGEIREPAPFEHGSVVQKAPTAVNMSVWRTRLPVTPPGTGGAAPQRRFPLLERPAAVTLARGNVYLVEETSAAVYVTYRQQSRPVRVLGSSPVSLPTRLLVVGDTLFVLDGSRGVLEPWPLPVPTEFDLGRQPETALENLYDFLARTRLLPTRPVPWKGSLDATLRDAGVGLGQFNPNLEGMVCRLNSICGVAVPVGKEIRVPDVPIESVIDFENVRAEDLGDGTLGELLDRRVLSAAFADRKSDQEVWDLNTSVFGHLTRNQRRGDGGSWTPDPTTVRQIRKADIPPGMSLTIPVEKVRCLAALPRAVLRDDLGLSKLRGLSPGFNWAPLEEVEAKAYSAFAQDPAPPPPPPQTTCNMQAVKLSLEEMRKTIHYRRIDGLPKVRVAVAEGKGIDVTHPDFGGNQAFAFLSNQAPSPTTAATPAPSPSPAASPGCDATPVEDAHGTGVAGLIAGKGAQSGVEALAPNVEIVPLRADDKPIGDDIASAYQERRTRIFNLSLHYRDQLVTHIRRRLREFPQALFVAAAGNDPTDGQPVCESDRPYPAYPVCEGWRNNVLVVAATNLAGDALIEPVAPNPGSNWNERVVSVAAPGIGYYVPGRNGGYQMADGTSFATPLVTATAALLFAQGVTDPWLIKQRIIATADLKDNLRQKVQGAGLLNMGRAVTEPLRSVLVKNDVETIAEVESGNITIKWPRGSRTIPLVAVRRLTRSRTGQSYRIVFLDDATDALVVREELDPGPWSFKYRKIDAAGNAGPLVTDDALENYKDYVGPVF